MIVESLKKAEFLYDVLIASGKRLSVGKVDAVNRIYHAIDIADKETVIKVIDNMTIPNPKGIEMPWGGWVKP